MNPTHYGPRWIRFLLIPLLFLWGIPGAAMAGGSTLPSFAGDTTLSSLTRSSTLTGPADSRTEAAVVKLHGCGGNLSTAFAVAVDQGTTDGEPGGKGLYLVAALHAVAEVSGGRPAEVYPCQVLEIEVGYHRQHFPVELIANRLDDDLALLLLPDRTTLPQEILPLTLADPDYFRNLRKNLPFRSVRQLGYSTEQVEITRRLGEVISVNVGRHSTRIEVDFDGGPGQPGDSGGAVVDDDGYLVGVYVGAGPNGNSALVAGDRVHAMVKEKLGVLATPTARDVLGVWVARVEGDDGQKQQEAFTRAIEEALRSTERGSRFEVRALGMPIRGTSAEVDKTSRALGAMVNAAVVVAIHSREDRLGRRAFTTYVTAIPREVPYRGCTDIDCSYQEMKRFQSLQLTATDEVAVTLAAKGTLGFVLMAEGLGYSPGEPEYEAHLVEAVGVLEEVLAGAFDRTATLAQKDIDGEDLLGAVGGELAVREALSSLYWLLSQGSLTLPGKVGDKSAFLNEMMEHTRRAIVLLERQDAPGGELGLAPEALAELRGRWASLQNLLGLALAGLPTVDRALNLQLAIMAYYQALTVKTREAFPADWAITQANLGSALASLPMGDRAQNLQDSIDASHLALTVLTREDFPFYWAITQLNLGNALSDLPTGDPAQNLQQAIDAHRLALTVLTRESSPVFWAATQSNLGNALSDLPTGDRTQNLQDAIDAHCLALTVLTRESSPVLWAAIQHNLGNALADRPTGDRALNLQNAMDAYHLALTVLTRETFPIEWAMIHYALGNALADLPTGDRTQSLKQAVDAFRLALTVLTREALPYGWAATQNNLGTALSDLPTGDRAQNLHQAIDAFRLALTVLTREDFPADWAMTQNNLGNALRNLPTGDRAQNLQLAIDAYHRALTVYTPESFPEGWAMTQTNLGNALQNLPTGGRAQNLQRAIDAYHRALTVLTREAFPLEHQITSISLEIATRRLWACQERDLDPGSPLASAHEGVAYLFEATYWRDSIRSLQGRDPALQAVDALSTAAAASPNAAEVHRHLGSALWFADRRDEALVAQRRAVELAPDNTEYRAELKGMEDEMAGKSGDDKSDESLLPSRP